MAKIPCNAKTSAGKPCRAAAGSGGLCFLHANPARAKQLGQLGGRKNRHFSGVDVEIPVHMSVSDLDELTARTIGLVLRGQLQAREAQAVACLINVQKGIIPLVEFEKRIADLERRAGQVPGQGDSVAQRGRELSTGGVANMNRSSDSNPEQVGITGRG